MKKTSTFKIEHVFNQLKNIQPVAPSNDLYLRIVSRQHVQKVIPLFWVKAVACLLLAFITTELYIVSSQENKEMGELSILLPETNNVLYHE